MNSSVIPVFSLGMATTGLADISLQEAPLTLRISDSLVFFSIWLACLLSTAIIFFLFYRTVSLREVSGYLMVTITTIDFATAQFIVFPSIYSVAVFDIPWKDTFLCTVQALLNVYLQNLKALTITLCALDRVFSIAYPFQYIAHATATKFYLATGVTAVLALIIPLIEFAFLNWESVADLNSGICWLIPEQNENTVMYYVSMVVNAFLPGAVVMLSYGAIFVIVIYQRSKTEAITVTRGCGAATDERRATPMNVGVSFLSHLAACKMLFVVTSLYFLSFVPIIVADHFFQKAKYVVWYHVCNYLVYFSTTTNCAIYYKMNKNFKASFKRYLTRLLECCHSADSHKLINSSNGMQTCAV